MAKSTKPKPAPAPDAAASAVAAPANAAAPPPLAELTPDALQARADDWDAAREALKIAGEAAAAAQAALDALPKDAADEQRDDALRALADAENAVKTAEARISALSAPAVFSIEGSTSQAVVTASEAGLAVSVTEGDDAMFVEDPNLIFQEVDALLAEADVTAAKTRLETELAHVRAFIVSLQGYAGKLADKLDTITTPPDLPRSHTTLRADWLFGGAETAKVRVTGPKAGRWRAGQYWGAEPVKAEISLDTYQALTADPQFTVEILDDGT